MIAHARVTLRSIAPYSQSKAIPAQPTNDARPPAEYELDMVWDRAHRDPASGEFYIPGHSLKMAVDAAAKRLKLRYNPGRGRPLLAPRFLSGVLVHHNIMLGITKESPAVRIAQVLCYADSETRTGERTYRPFPEVVSWEAPVTFTVTDDAITEEDFAAALKFAGLAIGIGRFRAENGGDLGRFEIASAITWEYEQSRDLAA